MSQSDPKYFKDIRARIRQSEKELVSGFKRKPIKGIHSDDIRSTFDKVYGSIRDLSAVNSQTKVGHYGSRVDVNDLVKDKRCPRCLQLVTKEAIYALGRLWHITHFNCGMCKQSIVNKRYFISHLQLHCLECYKLQSSEVSLQSEGQSVGGSIDS